MIIIAGMTGVCILSVAFVGAVYSCVKNNKGYTN